LIKGYFSLTLGFRFLFSIYISGNLVFPRDLLIFVLDRHWWICYFDIWDWWFSAYYWWNSTWSNYPAIFQVLW